MYHLFFSKSVFSKYIRFNTIKTDKAGIFYYISEELESTYFQRLLTDMQVNDMHIAFKTNQLEVETYRLSLMQFFIKIMTIILSVLITFGITVPLHC